MTKKRSQSCMLVYTSPVYPLLYQIMWYINIVMIACGLRTSLHSALERRHTPFLPRLHGIHDKDLQLSPLISLVDYKLSCEIITGSSFLLLSLRKHYSFYFCFLMRFYYCCKFKMFVWNRQISLVNEFQWDYLYK